MLTLGLPVSALIALAVRSTLGSPVLYRQQRLGLGGAPFSILKFRSMRQPRPGDNSGGDSGDDSGGDSSDDDHLRITRFGRLLRSTSLDEIPGFVNVLRGELTLVGPRPLPVRYRDRFIGDEHIRFEVRPGITGLAQIAGRNQLGWDERLALDVQYVRTRSLLGDIGILARTIPVVLSRQGVSSDTAVTMTELPIGRSR